MSNQTQTIVASAKTRRASLLDRYFYFGMSLLIALVVVYGFGQTVDHKLIHAVPVRPWVLYLHAGVFSGWVVFLILQSTLVRVRKVQVHRALGWFGVALGVVIPVLGISTAYTMDRFNIRNFNQAWASPFFAIQLWDMSCFTVAFALAIYWRKRPEFHRRMILIASCGLTAAAFARFPFVPLGWIYACVDLLILLGVVRDLIVNRRVHRIYLYALPILIAGQSLALYLALVGPRPWVKITDAILR